MTTPEQALVRRRLQVLDDRARQAALALETHETEDLWVTDFITNLAGAIENIGGKR